MNRLPAARQSILAARRISNATYIGSPPATARRHGDRPGRPFQRRRPVCIGAVQRRLQPVRFVHGRVLGQQDRHGQQWDQGAIFSRDLPPVGRMAGCSLRATVTGNGGSAPTPATVRANAISTSQILLNQWTHVVGVHDATDTGTNYLYVNGVLAAAPVGNAGYTPNASFPMFFAAWANTGTELPEFFFPGLLDEIAFSTRHSRPRRFTISTWRPEYPPASWNNRRLPAKSTKATRHRSPQRRGREYLGNARKLSMDQGRHRHPRSDPGQPRPPAS